VNPSHRSRQALICCQHVSSCAGTTEGASVGLLVAFRPIYRLPPARCWCWQPSAGWWHEPFWPLSTTSRYLAYHGCFCSTCQGSSARPLLSVPGHVQINHYPHDYGERLVSTSHANLPHPSLLAAYSGPPCRIFAFPSLAANARPQLFTHGGHDGLPNAFGPCSLMG
jgi:hypothetical protein